MKKINKFYMMNSQQLSNVKKIAVIVNEKYKHCNKDLPSGSQFKVISEDNKFLGIMNKEQAIDIAD